MKKNVGAVDRSIRIIVGLIILFVGYFYQNWWGIVGLLPLVTGIIGYCPRPGTPQTSSLPNILTAEMISGSFDTYGVFVGGVNNRCLCIWGRANRQAGQP
jgi:hypothetical protein